MSYCYMLHFSRPISPDHACQHYVGFTSRSLSERLADHARGRGARLTQVALERGIGWQVVRVWEGRRTDERRFKNRRNAPRYCPICNGEAARQWKEGKVIISHKGKQHSIKVLPKWAQDTIENLIAQRDELHKVINRMKAQEAAQYLEAKRAERANQEADQQAAELYA